MVMDLLGPSLEHLFVCCSSVYLSLCSSVSCYNLYSFTSVSICAVQTSFFFLDKLCLCNHAEWLWCKHFSAKDSNDSAMPINQLFNPLYRSTVSVDLWFHLVLRILVSVAIIFLLVDLSFRLSVGLSVFLLTAFTFHTIYAIKTKWWGSKHFSVNDSIATEQIIHLSKPSPRFLCFAYV